MIVFSSSPRAPQACHGCQKVFEEPERKHHCRSCGEGFCHPCSSHRMPVPERGWGNGPVRVCKACHRQGGPADTVNTQGETLHMITWTPIFWLAQLRQWSELDIAMLTACSVYPNLNKVILRISNNWSKTCGVFWHLSHYVVTELASGWISTS